MDEVAALVGDASKELYSYAKQLPYLRRANEQMENMLIVSGVSIQMQTSAVLSVVPSSSNIDLSIVSGYPSDMLVPIRLLERGGGTSFWPMDEREWEPETQIGSSLSYWTFRNSKIYTPGVTSTREVKIDYWRQLSAVTSSGDNEEVAGSKSYLSAKTAEMCARYIGQNNDIADQIRDNEVMEAKDLLERIYVKNSQSMRSRRKRFTRGNSRYVS